MLASVRRSRSRPLHAAALVAAPASGEQADGPAAKPQTAQRQLPGSFQWSSSGPLISPAQSINSVAAKDPSVVQDENGTWHVFFTKVIDGDWGLAHTSFTDFTVHGSPSHPHITIPPHTRSHP